MHFSELRSDTKCYKNLRICKFKLSQSTTKPTKWTVCPVKTDQPGHLPSLISLPCALNGKLRTQGFFMWIAKTLIRLGRCPGWSVFAGRTGHFVGFVMLWLKFSALTMQCGTQETSTWLCSRHHFMTCVRITTPVLPTPALQWITIGDFFPLPSSDSASRWMDSISSRKPVT